MMDYEEIPLTADISKSSKTRKNKPISESRSKSSQSLFTACHCAEKRLSSCIEINGKKDDESSENQSIERMNNLDVEVGGSGSRSNFFSRNSSRRASEASNLNSNLRYKSMSRLTPLSNSISSINSSLNEHESRKDDLKNDYDDDDDKDNDTNDEDDVHRRVDDANNNPLIDDYDPRERHSSINITESLVRRLPVLRRENRFYPGRIRKRVVLKNGNINLQSEHVDKRHRRYMQDMFTTMVDIRWRWNLLVFTMGFLLSWFSFAIVWWLIAFSHSDFEHITDPTWTPCINNLHSFASAILFSIETQHTIGYGSRYTTEECPEAMFLMCLQSIFGVMIQCFMVGFIFAKLSRPQKRSQTLVFSRHALTCLRDGKLCLMFRVGDLRSKSHIIGGRVCAQLVRRKITDEDENIPYYHRNLNVRFDDAGGDLFLIYPTIIVHDIDQDSPFYSMDCEAMMKEKFEIVVILEGTVESTGQSVQVRTSYLPSEIMWGFRFEQLIRYRNDTGEFLVDYSKFNNTFPIEMSRKSAKEIDEDEMKQKARQRGGSRFNAEEREMENSQMLSPPKRLEKTRFTSPLPLQQLPLSSAATAPASTFAFSESQRERIKFFES